MRTRSHSTSLAAAVAAVLLFAAAACIHNDIPYPRIQANFLTLNADGQTAGTVLDSVNRTATLTFGEETDIYAVKITDYTLTPGASLTDDIFSAPVDLSMPLHVTLRYYQDYLWTIRGVQNIVRYFDAEGLVGEPVIDVPGRRVVLTFTKSANLGAVRVLRAKLANEGSTMIPDIADGGTVDLREPLQIAVTVFDHMQDWTVYARRSDADIQTASVDAWTRVAWVTGIAQAGADNGIEYRLAGADEWTRVPADDITSSGGTFVARICHLSPATAYEARAYSGTMYGAVLSFTTGNETQLPDSDFDSWWLDGKIWDPWPEGGTPYWGTGNPGATTLGSSNTYPTDDTPTGSGWAACLETRFVGIGIIGKIAAGNIFAGSYVRTDGTNGILSFGRPFTERPTHLTGYYKYKGTAISHTSSDFRDLMGRPDTAIIWVALIDGNEPCEIRTNPNNRKLFNRNDANVIAYGELKQSLDVDSYVPFEIELQYKSTSRVPSFILVTASASAYGDYFTGGNGSTLYLDDFRLGYDY